jgi:hypothetical protein
MTANDGVSRKPIGMAWGGGTTDFNCERLRQKRKDEPIRIGPMVLLIPVSVTYYCLSQPMKTVRFLRAQREGAYQRRAKTTKKTVEDSPVSSQSRMRISVLCENGNE